MTRLLIAAATCHIINVTHKSSSDDKILVVGPTHLKERKPMNFHVTVLAQNISLYFYYSDAVAITGMAFALLTLDRKLI